MKPNYNKAVKRIFAQLNNLAYQRELDDQLNPIFEKMNQWKLGTISSIEISDTLFDFVKGESKDLYFKYTSGMNDMMVARAFVMGYIGRDEIPDNIFDLIQDQIHFCQQDIKREQD